MPRNEHGLTPKQEAFCQEYTKDYNGTQAATRAGYSAKTSNEQAARLLANVSISARVEQLKKESVKRVSITVDDVLQVIKDCMQIYKETPNLAQTSLKASNMAGNYLGMWNEKSDVNVNVKTHEQWLEEISLEEISKE